MTTSAYFASEIYRQQEKEMVRDLERRRIAAERPITEFNDRAQNRGRWAAIGVRVNRLQALVRHQPVRS